MKKAIIALVIIIILGLAGFFVYKTYPGKQSAQNTDNSGTTVSDTSKPATSTPQKNTNETVIGKSVQNRDITAYHYGSGSKELLFIGGIHGGYEWNTALVAYELMDYLKANPNAVPKNVKVTVIPVLNPDGLNKVVGTTDRFDADDVSSDNSVVVSGRFNANNVDLNRNFDCQWKPNGVWQSRKVSGGSKAFSEPESVALKNYVGAHTPAAVVAWFSSAGGVYGSECGSNVSAATKSLLNTYAQGSGYPAHTTFDSYETSGDMVNWFAKNNIPAISVLLTNHSDTEWAKNQAGVEAVLKSFAQ